MKKALSLILVLVMAAALLVCPALAAGGNGGGGGNGQSPLSVASVTMDGKELAGATAGPDGKITVTFDRGMDKHSEETLKMIYVKDLESVVAFDGDRTFTVDYTGAPAGEYTFVVEADAQANNGNTLGKDYEVTFTVKEKGNGGGSGESALSVVSVMTKGKELEGRALRPDGKITVTFDRGMDKHSEENVKMVYVEDLKSVVEFDGDRTFTVRFTGAPGGRYTFVVKADAMANNGSTLGEDMKVTFYVVDGSGEGFGEQCPSEDFADVDHGKDSWYHMSVDWAVSNDITQGTSKTAFSPMAPCTRAQAVTFLYRAAGSPSVDGLKNIFTDVAEGSYYYNAVLWAVDKGITQGTAADKFSPDDTCTREQIVTFLWRFENEPMVDVANPPFKDVTRSDYSYSAVLWAVKEGITAGTSADAFSPKTACSRAMIVTFLYRAMV